MLSVKFYLVFNCIIVVIKRRKEAYTFVATYKKRNKKVIFVASYESTNLHPFSCLDFEHGLNIPF